MALYQVIPSAHARAHYIVTTVDHVLHLRADPLFLLLDKFDSDWGRDRIAMFVKQKHGIENTDITSIVRR